MDFGKYDATDEQGQELDADFHRVGLEHVVLVRPVGIGEAHLLGAKTRVDPAPDRAEFALDAQLAAAHVGNAALDRTLEGRQAEGQEERKRGRQQEQDGGGPLEGAH